MLEIRIPDWLEFPSKEQALKYGEQAEVSVFLKAEAIFLLFDGSKEKVLPQQTELYQFSYLKEKTYDRLGPPLSPEDIDHLVEVGELEQVLFSEKYILTEDDYQEFSGNLMEAFQELEKEYEMCIRDSLGTDDDIICIDPTLEYFDIAEALGNQAAIINLSIYTKNYINPLEMDVWALDLNDSQGYIRDKGEFMLGLCEQCYGDNLNSRHKSIIDRCVRKLYIDIAKAREKHIPTMSEFYELLLEQPEEEAKDIALSLELFVNGSLNIFNNHTNVNVQARFIVYGTRDLGKELGAISTLVMLENISARIAENAKKGRATWLYIDEFHTVLDREYSAKFLFSLWKKVRKQGGLCTGITQNLVDMLQNYTAMTMLGNSEFIALLKQSNVDSQELSSAAGIPEAQLKYVDNSPSGTGIIKYGNTCIPFDNRMEKEDNPLYALFNTNLHEKALQTKQE